MNEIVKNLFHSIDAMDTDKFVTFLTDDAEFRFGNAPSAIGKEQIHQGVAGFFSSIKGLSHELAYAHVTDDTVITEGTVTYTRFDDSKLSVSFCNVFGMKGDLIQRYFIYIDLNELYA